MTLNRLVLAASLAYGLPGLALTFGPDEVLRSAGGSATPLDLWLVQLLGAALLGLAVLNWVQRYALVGGIYGRPLLLANLIFSTVGFFASARTWSVHGGRLVPIVSVMLGLLLLGFGRALSRTPAAVRAAPGPDGG
jgi:hypothetical protein